jgi:competence ComEA-like helix-hairpin-helix protein
MSDAETRALGRAATLLLVASTLRWGWQTVGARQAAPPPGPDGLPELLEESRAAAADARERARPLEAGERLDPNRASAAELDRLPGIGPATARAIVASREQEGPFAGPEDLVRVKGVGPKALERIRGHLDLSRPAPAAVRAAGDRRRTGPGPPVRPSASGPDRIDVNRADETALQRLPGIGPALARRIVEARTERPFRSLEDLGRVRGIGPATLARLGDLVTVGR